MSELLWLQERPLQPWKIPAPFNQLIKSTVRAGEGSNTGSFLALTGLINCLNSKGYNLYDDG